jgi:hypothetical protein
VRKAYLLIYSDHTGSRDRIKYWANQEPMVATWRYDLPNCFYLISEYSANDLAESLRSFTGNAGRFLIVEPSANRQGWLPSASWYLLRNKKHKPKEE